jgi:hypothetical protein
MLLGSALTLLIHPVSREYLFGVLQLEPPNSVAELANIHPSALPKPSNTIDAAYWLQIASDKAIQGGAFSQRELSTLISVGKAAEKLEIDNAYWPQMLAVFLFENNRQAEARAEWARASHCQNWNDLQTKRLLKNRLHLAELGHFNQAWTYGYVYFARSDSPAKFIEAYAKKLVANSTIDDLAGITLRYQTVCNGSLLRDGSRSIRVGKFGADIVELATYPPSLSEVKGVKRLWIAQTSTVARLRQFGLADEARFADACFRKNEAWKVHTQAQDVEETVRNMCLAAIALSALPGSLMICALMGAAGLLAVKLSRGSVQDLEFFSPKVVFPIGVIAALIAFWITKSWVVSVCLGGSLAFQVFNPRSVRKLRLNEMGPLFSLCLGSIWFVACSALSVYFISRSTAASAMLPLLGPSGEYFSDTHLFLAVTFAMLSLLFLTAPAWAILRKQRTPLVFIAAMQKFSAFLCLGSLALCAFSGPSSVYGDKTIAAELDKIVQNEPIYYQDQPF